MKKRYIAIAAGGSLFAMVIAGFAVTQAEINACNAGDEKVCKSLAKTFWDDSLVRSEIRAGGAVFFTEAAKYEKQAKAKEAKAKEAKVKEAKAFQVNRTSVAMLALDCEKKFIRPDLKDPNSFRELNHSYIEHPSTIDVTVNYTATNGFGGRVRGTKTCTYTL